MASQSDKKQKKNTNGLRILVSDTRIRAENAAQTTLPITQNNQPNYQNTSFNIGPTTTKDSKKKYII